MSRVGCHFTMLDIFLLTLKSVLTRDFDYGKCIVKSWILLSTSIKFFVALYFSSNHHFQDIVNSSPRNRSPHVTGLIRRTVPIKRCYHDACHTLVIFIVTRDKKAGKGEGNLPGGKIFMGYFYLALTLADPQQRSLLNKKRQQNSLSSCSIFQFDHIQLLFQNLWSW